MTHRPVGPCQGAPGTSHRESARAPRVSEAPAPPSPPPRAPRHEPLSGPKVYATLAAILLGIILVAASCCGAWLYYVEIRGQR